VGCLHYEDDSFCVPSNLCLEGCCDASKGGCYFTELVCNDNNPCTKDTCVAGKCKFVDNSAALCTDGLKCTKDVCTKDDYDPTKPKCSYPVDLGLCGILTSCQTASCGYDRDCLIIPNDELCPVHPKAPACLLPLCTPGTGTCSFQDICGASHPDCGGFASCTFNPTLNKCVKTIPTKRSLENDNQSTIVVVDEMNGGQIISVGIIYLFFILCLSYMINKL